MNVKRLRKVVDAVRSVPSEDQFDMDRWDCRTAACAVGWYIRSNPGCGLYIFLNVVEDGCRYQFDAVGHHFGITRDDAFTLFRRYEDTELNTRAAVIERIEAFIGGKHE